MAKFRKVQTTFWQDSRVLEELTPEDKYFYLYLLTNPNTTQIGVYQITKKQMAFDLGYSTESISSLLDRFINVHRLVKYNEKTREIAINNWGKHNLANAGKPVIDCIKKELQEVKDLNLLVDIISHIPNEDIATLFSRTVHGTYNDTSTLGGEEEEKEEEKEEETKTHASPPFREIIEYLNEKSDSCYRYTTSKTQELIRKRWKEGFRLDDFKTVIDKKVTEWIKHKEMSRYLRPETLFGNKFEGYLNQKVGDQDKKPPGDYDKLF